MGDPAGTIKAADSLARNTRGIVKSLKKGLSVRETAKVNDVAISNGDESQTR